MSACVCTRACMDACVVLCVCRGVCVRVWGVCVFVMCVCVRVRACACVRELGTPVPSADHGQAIRVRQGHLHLSGPRRRRPLRCQVHLTACRAQSSPQPPQCPSRSWRDERHERHERRFTDAVDGASTRVAWGSPAASMRSAGSGDDLSDLGGDLSDLGDDRSDLGDDPSDLGWPGPVIDPRRCAADWGSPPAPMPHREAAAPADDPRLPRPRIAAISARSRIAEARLSGVDALPSPDGRDGGGDRAGSSSRGGRSRSCSRCAARPAAFARRVGGRRRARWNGGERGRGLPNWTLVLRVQLPSTR